MKTVFVIDGGAGRAICSIPALLKYAKNNPNDDFTICVYGWDNLFWGLPELQERTFNADNKGIFDRFFLNATRVISPEPYRLPEYYRQTLHMTEAFDKLINETDDHSDLENIKLILNKNEELSALGVLSDMMKEPSRQNKLNVVIQPWGSTARKVGEYTIDDTSRSLESGDYVKLVNRLSEKYNLIYFGDKMLVPQNEHVTAKIEGDLRFWAAMIEACDYFIGVDSVGQHFARAFNKPGTVILGSTFAENISYKDHFNIFEKSGIKKYSAIRINNIDSHLADRLNDTRMQFNDEEFEQLCNSIEKDIERKCNK